MPGEQTVGGIVGFLRLENDQFVRAINEALGKAEQLDGKKVDVQVDADTAKANAQLAATEKQVDRLDRANARVSTSSRNAGRGMGMLATAVIGLGPALVPVAAGATALGVAFGGMATAGVLAVVGVAKEMQEGTAVGLTYRFALQGAKTDLVGLGRVAAGNVLKPFLDIVDDLNARMPALRGQIGDLATVTGKTAAALAGGLLNAFQSLEPLMRDASVYVLRLSQSFQTAMSGQGVVAFGDYIRSVFPQVLDALGSITAAAAHLVASLAPLGLGVLSGLQMLSDLLRLIPVDVLAVLAQGAGSVFLAFKAWQGIRGLIDGVNGALVRVNSTLAISAGALRGLNIAAGVIGVALAAFSFIVSRNAEQQREAAAAADRYADALRESNGVIDESIRQSTAKALADAGVLDAARQLGLNLPDVTDAALGNADAMARVNAAIDANPDVWIRAVTAGNSGVVMQGRLNGAADKVRAAVLGENEALTAGIQKNRDLADATKVSADATSGAASAAQILADKYGTTAGTYSQVATSQQAIADKAAAATLQMQLENDAAGLLKQTLDILNGEAISAAQAQQGFDRAMLAVGKSTRDTDGKIVKANTALKGNSEAAVTNRGNLLTLAQSAVGVAEAYGQQKDSAEAGRKKLGELRTQIIDNAVAQGMNREEVEKFIDQVLKIPKKVPPTKADIDKAEAERKLKALQSAINGITGKTVTMTIKQVYQQFGQNAALRVHNEQVQSRRDPFFDVRANGGLTLASGVRAMAAGDLLGGRGAMIMRSRQPILWNEAPGGEAYIPLAPSRRARSVAIWEQTGRELGVSGGRGPIELGEASLARLAQLVRNIRVQSTVSAGQFDRAMGAIP